MYTMQLQREIRGIRETGTPQFRLEGEAPQLQHWRRRIVLNKRNTYIDVYLLLCKSK